MELAIRPEDLHAAAVALLGCSARLDDAERAFARRARIDVPGLGVRAESAGLRGAAATEHAADILSGDLRRLAHALAALAHHYPQVDSTAVPTR
jgi:hypothetical protein